ncbi:TPA: integrase, partial [Clostridioides difficile]|nr:integrase [Clostridioides difficile]
MRNRQGIIKNQTFFEDVKLIDITPNLLKIYV